MPGRIDDFDEFDLGTSGAPSYTSSYLRTRIPTPERELDRAFSIYRSARRRIELDAMRGGPEVDVSGYKYMFEGIPFEQSPADKLITRILERQATPEIVARNIGRTQRLLDRYRNDQDRRKPSTAYVNFKAAQDVPRTVFGTEAWIGRRYFPKTSAQGTAPKFVNRLLALPCVERTVRREVLFAKKKAGRGRSHTKRRHRMGPFSDIWC